VAYLSINKSEKKEKRKENAIGKLHQVVNNNNNNNKNNDKK